MKDTSGQIDSSATTRQKLGALGAVTVVGGTLLVNGSPAGAVSSEVTNTDASGPGSLAQAVLDANSDGALDTITFADGLSGTISLTSQLTIKYDVAIVGPGDGSITLTNPTGQVLYTYHDASLTVSGLTIESSGGFDTIGASSFDQISLTDLELDGGTVSLYNGDEVALTSVEVASDVNDFYVELYNVFEVTLSQVSVALSDSDLDIDVYRSEYLTVSNVTATANNISIDVGDTYGVVLTGLDLEASRDVDVYVEEIYTVAMTDISLTAGDDARLRADDVYTTVDVSGVQLNAYDGARIDVESDGETTVTDVVLDGLSDSEGALYARVQVEGQMSTLSGATIDTTYGSVYARGGTVEMSDVDLTAELSARGGARSYDGSADVSDVVLSAADNDGRASMWVSGPSADVSGIVLDAANTSLGLEGDSRRVIFLRPDAVDEPAEEPEVWNVSDVSLGDENSNSHVFVRGIGDFQVFPDEPGDELDGDLVDPPLALSDMQWHGGLTVYESNVELSNVTIAAPAEGFDRFVGLYSMGRPLLDEVDFTPSGPTDDIPVSVAYSVVSFDQVTVAGFDSEHIVSTAYADVSIAHSTIGDNTVSGAPIQAAGGWLALDHTIIADTGVAGTLAEHGIDDFRLRLLQPDAATPGEEVPELTVEAEYSLLPTGVVADLGLADSNVETDDPRLGSLGDNGGTLDTVLPLPGSPAIDAGDAAIADAPALDQRGQERIVDTIDIGSVESTTLLESIAPARFVDTRDGQETIDGEFEGGGKRTSGSVYEVQIAGRDEVPAGATAVVMNITAIAPDGPGYVTAYDCDAARPDASSLNFAPGSNVGNEIVTGLSADGKVCLFTQGTTHLTVDVVAYATELSAVRPLVPARALETRTGKDTADGRFEGVGRMVAGSTQTVGMAGRNGVPDDAAAVIVNVTAIKPETNGYLTLHACLPETPLASSLNFAAGAVRGNEVVVQLDEFGDMCVFASTATDVTIDVVGYLPAGAIESITPARLLETRDGQVTADGESQGGGPVTPGSTTTLPIAGRAGIPADVKAVVANVTAINPSSRGYVTVSPCVLPTPTASSLNYEAGVSGGNEIIAEVNDDGEICLFSSSATHLAVDVVAFIR
ncbi:choice-of-anchor Q domain-containing protein [Ilumatobacter coccineus]|uniref:Uncharacterized protein n=1 Tax=Ilumatobacter coccineus (strain NBRC 103263 / KCTC 29153 / YM16-304) TaxID=1313172 RepID=A0A6C7E663_ILUCY|nr:choice-of-anchor Q domain-containing protein [Ilumatobacter coccineus]BAN03224.1 hypothetical protein YM304_29100 [Ilumatobacter coccineus YM16-304]